MKMFGMDPEYWEEHHEKMMNSNLRKGNVGEDPNRWGGLPEELFPGYNSLIKVTGYRIPNHIPNVGGGVITDWQSKPTHSSDSAYVVRALEELVPNTQYGYIMTLYIKKDSHIEIDAYLGKDYSLCSTPPFAVPEFEHKLEREFLEYTNDQQSLTITLAECKIIADEWLMTKLKEL